MPGPITPIVPITPPDSLVPGYNANTDAPVHQVGPPPTIPTTTTNSAGSADWESAIAAAGQRAQEGATAAPNFTDVNQSAINTSGRYPLQILGANNENLYGQGQGALSKMIAGITKGVVLAGTTFAQSTIGLAYGVGAAIGNQKLSSFYNNDFNNTLDHVNEEMDNSVMPNYYTDEEKNAAWYSPSHWMTMNFAFDKVVKNLGMIAGTAASGYVFGSAISALGDATKLFSVGKSLEAVQAAESALVTAKNSGETLDVLNNLQNSYKNLLEGYKTATTAQKAVISGLNTLGMSSIFANGTVNSTRQQLITEFENTKGYQPTGADLDAINDRAENAGNASYLLNAALLTATNYIHLPKILSSVSKLDKADIEALGGNINPVKFNASTGAYEALPISKGVQLGNQISSKLRFLFSPTEAVAFGGLGLIPKAVENYYGKMNNKDGQDVLNATWDAIKTTVTTTDGIDQFLMGGLSGGLTEGLIAGIKGKITDGQWGGVLGEAREKQNRTNAFLEADAAGRSNNEAQGISSFGFMKETSDSVKRAVQLSKDREEALATGDMSKAKDLEQDYLINFLTPKIKYGLYKDLRSNLSDIMMQAQTDEGFAQLQAEGKAHPLDTREDFTNRLQNTIDVGDKLNDSLRAIGIKYKTAYNTDAEGNKVFPFTDDVINQLAYVGAKIGDYDKRIGQMSNILTSNGIEAEMFINRQHMTGDRVNDAIQTIDNNPRLTNEQKDDLKSAVVDSGRLSLERDAKVMQYNDIINNPEKYQVQAPDPITKPSVTTADGTSMNTGVPYTDENGVKVTINSKNEDGTYNVTDEGGETKNLTEAEFNKLKLFNPEDAPNANKNFIDKAGGEDYTLRMGSTDVQGKLKYDVDNDKLSFQYEDEGGNPVSIPLHSNMFAGNNPLVKPTHPLSDEAQTALTTYALSNNGGALSEDAFNVLSKVHEDYNAQIDAINKTISEGQDRLSKISEQLDHTNYTTDGDGKKYNKEGKLMSKKALKEALTIGNALIDLQKRTEVSITQLEAQRDRLQFQKEYAESHLRAGEDFGQFKERMKQQQAITEDMIVDNGLKRNALAKISDRLTDAISAVQRQIRHLTALFSRNSANDMPYSKELIDELRNNPEFMHYHPNFERDVASLNRVMDELQDVEIKPSQKELNDVNKKIKELSAELNGAEQTFGTIKDINDKIAAYEKQVNEEAQIVKNQTEEVASDTESLSPKEQEQAEATSIEERTPVDEVIPSKGEEDISDEDFDNFIDKDEVTEEIIDGIANKIIDEKELTPRETAILAGKTSDVETKLKEEAAPPSATTKVEGIVNKSKNLFNKGKESLKKNINRLFSSTTQNTIDAKSRDDQKRHAQFLDNISRGKIANPQELRRMTVHSGTEHSLGLEGLENKQLAGYDINNPETGKVDNNKKPLMVVYVRKVGNGDYYYIDVDGNTIGKVPNNRIEESIPNEPTPSVDNAVDKSQTLSLPTIDKYNNQLDVQTTPEEAVLQTLSTPNLVIDRESHAAEVQGRKNTGFDRQITTESKTGRQYKTEGGVTIPQLVESISENVNKHRENGAEISDQDIRNTLIDYLNEFPTRESAARELYRRTNLEDTNGLSQAEYDQLVKERQAEEQQFLAEQAGRLQAAKEEQALRDVFEPPTKIDLDKIVYGVQAGPSLTWGNEYGNEERYSGATKEEAQKAQEDYLAKREALFNSTNTYEISPFEVSRGVPDRDGVAKAITKNLTTEEELAKKHLIHVDKTTKTIELPDGSKETINGGQVYFREGNTLETLNTKSRTIKDRQLFLQALQELVKTYKLSDGVNEKLLRYLAGTTYLRDTDTRLSVNQYRINGKTGTLDFGKESIPFTPDGLKDNTSALGRFFLGSPNSKEAKPGFNVNAKLLTDTNTFSEFKGLDKEGQPIWKDWDNYQQFLTSDEGGKRPANEIPVTTTIKEGHQVFSNRYSYTVGKPEVNEFTKKEPYPLSEEDIPPYDFPTCND